MAHRFVAFPVAVIAVLVGTALQVSSQSPATRNSAAGQATTEWTQGRTPDGQPDITGYWTNATYTPLERPEELAGQEFFTPQEAAAYEKRRLDAFLAQPKDNIHYDDAIWQTETYAKGVASLRTSLIVDPRDGRIPPLTPEAKKRAAERAARRRNPSDAAEYRTLAERCITWGNDIPPMLPPGYYANLQIMQGSGYVVVLTELIHSARLIPLDGRPHLSSNVSQLMGDSRGHWEGNTLVVDTVNFTNKTAFRGSSENLHVVERFTRVGRDAIRYEFTVEDPTTWTRPWTAQLPLQRMDGPLFEYACSEGNYGLANILRGARVEEAKATP